MTVAMVTSLTCLVVVYVIRRFYGMTQRWLRGRVVERRSVTGELSLSYTRPAADGWPLMWVNRTLEGQTTRPIQSVQGRRMSSKL